MRHLPSARILALAAILLAPALGDAQESQKGVKVAANDAARRVDVTIDGQPFTSYIYPTSLKKPVLYPILTASGTPITRGYPLEPRPGERADHPHQIGLWFSHGDVNGLDFWNNSDAIGPDRAPKMGAIVHRRVVDTQDGAERGELVVESDWVSPDGTPLLRERTQFIFSGGPGRRTIERVATLTAAGEKVTFRDNKEGSLGIRVVRQLEQPENRPQILIDETGKPSKSRLLDNAGVSGRYRSSEGLEGDAVWGTRAKWTMLTGTLKGEPVTVAILDHPSNATYPTYWHARGYGLFSANVFGRKVFKETEPELTVTLEPGNSLTLRYQVLVLEGKTTPDTIEKAHQAFAAAAATSSR